MISFSILILTKNGGDEFIRCLESVYNQTEIARSEVIVVDSGSTDGTLEVLERFPVQVHQISPETFHHARTRNMIASLAKAENLVFLSQDAVPSSNSWLQAMADNFADPAVGAVYGRQLPKEGSSLERQDALDAVYGAQRVVKDPARRNGLGYRFYHFSDVNAAIRRSVWQMTKFPEELLVFEDLGIAKRILDGGWKIVYEPQACVFHSHHHTTLGLFKRYFDIGYTLRDLHIWNEQNTRSSLVRDAGRLLANKLRRIGVRGGARRASFGILQDIAKSAGLFLGLQQAYLPYAVKRHLSAHNICD
jgi:rhamnosyltransferase